MSILKNVSLECNLNEVLDGGGMIFGCDGGL